MALPTAPVTRGDLERAAGGSDEELAAWLDQHAAALLAGNSTLLIPHLDRLLSLPYQGRPWLELVTAATLFTRSSRDERAWRLLRTARGRFQRAGDRTGLGCAHYVEGNWQVTVGDVQDAARSWQEGRAHLGPHTPAYAHSLANQAWGAYASGELGHACTLAQEAVALAVRVGDSRALGTAYTHLAAYEIWVGAFGQAALDLDRADRAFQGLSDPGERYEWPLALVMTGAVHVLRGRHELAEVSFRQAVTAAEATGSQWVAGVVHAIRADVCAPRVPQRSIEDGQHALAVLADVGERWWSTWARVAIGRALGAQGHRHAAARTIGEVLDEGGTPPVEGARHLMLLGEQFVDVDPARAADLFTDAIRRFDQYHAPYWSAHARARLALVDRTRSTRHWDAARATAPHEPAVAHMIRELATLRVCFRSMPTVQVDGREVRFPTRHALHALLLLAAHSPDGLRADTLGAHLWPDADTATQAHRLKTTLWQVRSQLGSAAGRLHRRTDRVILDLTPDECDLRESVERARVLLRAADPDEAEVAATCRALRQPFVVADAEEWAAELTRLCDGLVHRLTEGSRRRARRHPVRPATRH
ncbi:hypothetical protein GA0070616_0698 [Micromonospora nigra]|uniref:Bacterial transcriptional activator domain-containing protein n=1 Tax=Micromonospora nigra TaxID=145857 RepID=A0A1C6RE60_9ACTN|nr:hypothetical protein [Micromonospora nigra]SCL15334.1 hypothetical protein GA0070616_0698 [Micromonospora nigra]